jgi:hypothetical protein
MKDILYSTALNLEGQIITTKDAVKGVNYSCTICNGEMIFKKGDKEIRRPHFAHKVLSPNCNPETALHNSFANLLCQRIQNHLDNNQPLTIKWECQYCGDIHQRNLLSKTAKAEREYIYGPTRPDIALLNKEGKPLIALEVVVTHFPEDNTEEYYDAQNIALIEFHLKSDSDIDKINHPTIKPSKVNRCLNPKCPTCGRYQYKKYLFIAEVRCWKCNSPMKAAITARKEGMINGPEAFNIKELELAKLKGVVIKEKYSKTAEQKYLANTCNKCDSFYGEFFLFDIFVDCSENEVQSKIFEVGYFCEYCHQMGGQKEKNNLHPYNMLRGGIPPDAPFPNKREF